MIRDFLLDEEGLTSVEIVLIVLVLVGLVVIFKSQLMKILSDIFGKINKRKNSI